MSGNSHILVILTRNNYQIWARSLSIRGDSADVGSFITTSDTPVPITYLPDHIHYYKAEEAAEKYRKKKALAFQIIYESLDEAHQAIADEYAEKLLSEIPPRTINAYLLFQQLNLIHSSNKLYSALVLFKSFASNSVSNLDNIPSYIDNNRTLLNAITSYMKSSGESVPQKFIGYLLLTQLEGERFDNFKSNFKDEDIIPSIIFNKLMNLHDSTGRGVGINSKSGGGEISIKAEALLSRTGGNGGYSGAIKVCTNCGKNHVVEECWKLYPAKEEEYFKRFPNRKKGAQAQNQNSSEEKNQQSQQKQQALLSIVSSPSLNLTTSTTPTLAEEDADSPSLFGYVAAVALLASPSKSHIFILDSGATSHMFNSSSYFSTLSTLPSPVHIGVAKASTSIISYKSGDVKVGNLILKGCLLVEGLASNLVSVGALISAGMDVQFGLNGATVSLGGKVLFTASRNNLSTYNLDLTTVPIPIPSFTSPIHSLTSPSAQLASSTSSHSD